MISSPSICTYIFRSLMRLISYLCRVGDQGWDRVCKEFCGHKEVESLCS